MTREELLKRLALYEWNDFEVKKAQRDVPQDAYKTVSAFANTCGGWLVFGVRQADGAFEMLGVMDVDKVQNDFITTLRGTSKFNSPLDLKETALEMDGKQILVFYVPEVPRQQKPIYLNGRLGDSYRRIGGCDVQCTNADITALLREASNEPFDGEAIAALSLETCFEKRSLEWCRSIFGNSNPRHNPAQSDLEFLREWGLLKEKRGELQATRASILLVGTPAAFRQVLPRPLVDCQRIDERYEDPLAETRWTDRLLLEENLIESWKLLNEWYLRHAEKPFSLDSGTMRRNDLPPDIVTFREAAANLLIHQDYAAIGATPSIKFYRDRLTYQNPGHAFADEQKLLEPGDKDVRNPLLCRAFRMIGAVEQAGTGIPTIMRGWQQLGYLPPRIRNDKEQRTFEVTMLRELLLSEEQILFQGSLGVSLTEDEAKLFAYVCSQERVTEITAKTVLSRSTSEARRVLEKLVVQALLVVGDGGTHWLVSDHLRDHFAQMGNATGQSSLVSDQAGAMPIGLVTDQPQPERKPLTGLTETQVRILELCAAPQAIAHLLEDLKVTNRTFFRRTHLNPLIEGGILQLQYPDKPKHPSQAYLLTEAGLRLLESRRARQKDQGAK
jgi:ATP-dependent DNA helicase RecG